jgi:hypothetical protein
MVTQSAKDLQPYLDWKELLLTANDAMVFTERYN